MVDLYRFDVPKRSDVDLRLGMNRNLVTPSVLSETGDRIGSRHLKDKLRVRLPAGRYFVTLRATGFRHARYHVTLLIREITKTSVDIDGARKAVLPAPRTVQLTATVEPESATGGVVRIQVDYLDPLQGWVFVKQFKPRIQGTRATVAFTPRKIGSYIVHASFFGNHAASPSKSERSAHLVVAPPTQ